MTKPLVLVVDDDDLNLEVMEAHLEHKYRVALAHSGTVALKAIEANPPDLVLLDVRMGGMSGYEVARTLKANVKTANIPILIMTGLQENQDIRDAIEAGADDLVFKPIKFPLMMLRVQRMLDCKLLQDQTNA